MGRVALRSFPAEMLFLMKHQSCPAYNLTQVMYMRSKHYKPLFRTRRKEKMLFVDKDKYADENLSYKEKREKDLKDKHAEPERSFRARKPSSIETYGVFDPFVPPEGDGKHSVLGKKGLKEVAEKGQKKVMARVQAVRKIRKYGDHNFNTKNIAYELLELYIEAHNLLTDYKKNKNRLHELCTLRAMNLMTHNMDRVTCMWEYVESLAPPKTVHVACEEVNVKDIYFAQVTVRIHSKQKLALYDQFGRLMFGSPHLEKDVLDFVVFEKNIVDMYGKWRLHDKIRPDWLPQLYKNQSVRLPEEYSKDVEDEEQKETG